MSEKDTIVAIATPQGIGALAIIRVSGTYAFTVVEKGIQEKEKFKRQSPRYIANYTIITKKNKVIDDVTAIKYSEPKSFTGEDAVEIICHGGIYTREKIVECIIQNGARIADRGEFTKRAYLNGKIDLLKAESIKGIIDSTNEIEHTTALNFYREKNQEIIQKIRKSLIEEISKIDAEIEFQDEEQNNIQDNTSSTLLLVQKELKKELQKSEILKKHNEELEVVIVGPTNAGKSSVFNELLSQNRAIVSDIPGTTRDIISEIVFIDSKKIKIIDTAGIRKTIDKIEYEGQKRSQDKAFDAKVVIWISDISVEVSEEERMTFFKITSKNPIVVLNKNDLIENREKIEFYEKTGCEVVILSVKKKNNITLLLKKIKNYLPKEFSGEENISFIMNSRQSEKIVAITEHIEKALQYWKQKEITSYYLKKAVDELDSISGKTHSDEIMNSIFTTFCIGK